MSLAEQLQGDPGVTISEPYANGDPVFLVEPGQVHALMSHAKALGFDYLMNLTCVDWPDGRAGAENAEPEIEVVYNLYATASGDRLAVQTFLARAAPAVASVVDLWKGADWHEREMWDLMGVRFEGHPNLRRILLPEGWEGHPLRKDYDLAQEQFVYREDGEDRVTKDPTRGW